jgi:hypothetical protein
MQHRRLAIGLAALAALVLIAVWRRGTWVVKQLLVSNAPAAIAERTGDVYRVEVHRVRFNALRRRIAVESIRVTTNEDINAKRQRPLPAVRLTFHDCAITGIHVFSLITSRGLIAKSFGCRGVSAAAQMPPPSLPGRPLRAAPRPGVVVVQRGLRLPTFAPRVLLARIDFPHTDLDFRFQWARGDTARLELDHLEWHMTDVTVDPADSAATSRLLFSRKIDISATSFLAYPDSTTALRVARFEASLPDSTVEIRGFAFAPTISDSAFAQARPYRRSRLSTTIARIAIRGLDVGAFVLGTGVRARTVQVDSLRVDVLSDKRRPPNPKRTIRRTPQRWIADLARSWSVDSVLLQGSEVTYREHHARRPQPGVLTFARLDASIVNVRHVPGRRSDSPTTLRATAFVQDEGRLDTEFLVPLDAQTFTMTFRGTLGAMDATSLNTFIHETMPLQFTKGRIQQVTFDARVTNGAAQGFVTPRYKDLTIKVTGRGSEGVLGTGGVIGDAARGIATAVGGAGLHAANPDRGEQAPRRGAINLAFSSTQTLPAFVWGCLRTGLLAAVRK